MIYLILIAIYTISFLLAWKETNNMYNTKWRNINPSAIDVVMVLLPVINTAESIIYLSKLLSFKTKIKIDPNKFFKINKRF